MTVKKHQKIIEYVEIHISEIVDIHPTIKDLEKNWAMPPFTPPLLDSLCPEGVVFMLKNLPICVTQCKSGYQCIGNIRMYRLARNLLDPKEKITAAITRFRLKKDEIHQRYLAEFFLLPAIHHLNRNEINIFFDLWKPLLAAIEKVGEGNFSPILKCKTKTAFRRIFK